MNVFISYRRAETRDLAGRLADRLRHVRGIDEVFFDTSAIRPGAEFMLQIKTALARRPIGIVVIGLAWRGPLESIRIFDDADPVRLEVAGMLENSLRIIPVLVNAAVMPKRDELPEDLRRLVDISAIHLRHDSFDRDLAALIDAILLRRSDPNPRPGGWLVPLRRSLVLGLLAEVGLFVLAGLHYISTGQSLGTTLGEPDYVPWLVVAVFMVAALAGFLTPARGRP